MAFAKVLDIGHEDGTTFGKDTSAEVSFYGVTPVSQRAGAAQATSLVGTASSTDVTTALKAAVVEIMDTLQAMGVWKGSA